MNFAAYTYNDEYIKRYLAFNINRVKIEGRKAVAPPPDLTVSEWADNCRILPDTAYLPGKWRTDRAPHLRAIMDAINNPAVRQIDVMASSQIGKTEAINNIIGYLIDVDPCNIIFMCSTDKDAKEYVDQKLEPMIEDTPELRSKVGKRKKKSGEVTNEKDNTYRKKYIGGTLLILTGRSSSALRGKSARVTIGDDIDAIEIGHTKEGDPVLRLAKRSTTYADSLNINISSPGRDSESRIQKLVEQGCGYHYKINCPYCNHQQELVPEQLAWNKDRDMFGKTTKHYEDTVRYKCINCSAELTEAERTLALINGNWIAERPWVKDHFSFIIGEISSTLSTMEKVAKQITTAKCDVTFDDKGRGTLDTSGADLDKLEALVNTVFGRPYVEDVGKKIDELKLMERAINDDYIDKKDIKIPDEVLLLTAFVDLQEGMDGKESRLEIKVMGWGLGEENWIIYLGTIPGNLHNKNTWNKLDEFWDKKWFRKDGVELKIKLKFIDSGYLAPTVYNYVRYRDKEGIYATKGANKYGASLLQRKPSLVDKGRVRLIIIGTQEAKQEIFTRLEKVTEPGPKYTHFAKCFCGADYFKQLGAEVAVRHTTGLVDYYVYERRDDHAPNEAIDQFVGNFTAMKMYTSYVKLETLDKKLKQQVKYVTPAGAIKPEQNLTKEEANNSKQKIKKKKRAVINIR